jgi:hypothetical protein
MLQQAARHPVAVVGRYVQHLRLHAAAREGLGRAPLLFQVLNLLAFTSTKGTSLRALLESGMCSSSTADVRRQLVEEEEGGGGGAKERWGCFRCR